MQVLPEWILAVMLYVTFSLLQQKLAGPGPQSSKA